MKKVMIGFFLIVMIVLITFLTWYNQNLQRLKEIAEFNKEYEEYLNRAITGVDLTTIMNKAIENNNRYGIRKNEKGAYQDDDKYAIEIIVKPTVERRSLFDGSFRDGRNERFYKNVWRCYFSIYKSELS